MFKKMFLAILSIVLAAGLIMASPLSSVADSPLDYFSLSYTYELDRNEIDYNETFHIAVSGTAVCIQDLAFPYNLVNEIEFTGQAFARHTVSGVEVSLCSPFKLNVRSFPKKKGESAHAEATVNLQFPSDCPAGTYTATGRITKIMANSSLGWLNVTSQISESQRTQNLGSLIYSGPPDKPDLIVTAHNAARVYGAPGPELNGTITGIVDGDPISATYSTPAGLYSPPGSYPIVPEVSDGGSGKLVKYDVVLHNGTLTVSRADTVIVLNSSSGASFEGQSVTFTAAVSAAAPGSGTPTGSVRFLDGSVELGTASLNSSGSAVFSTASLAAGSHSITAVYSGSANFNTGTSPVLMHTVTVGNKPPSGISLSNSTLAENQPVNSLIGIFNTVDPDSGDTFTWTLVSGAGSSDNGSFNITGNELRSAAVFNYEIKSSYSIRVRTTDAGGAFFEKPFTISVVNVNESPTGISLSGSTVPEKQPSGTTVGTLAASDPDSGDTFVYSLVSGTGSENNSSFSISGNTLKTAAVLDYGVNSTLSIRVRAADAAGLYFEKVFVITVTRQNHAPLAHNLAVSTSEDTGRSITLSGEDSDGDSLTFTVVSGPSHGTLTGSAPSLYYTPDTNYHGTDSFTFRVNDGQASSSPATVSISISPVNDPPAAYNRSISTSRNTPVTISLPASDVESASGTLVFSIVAGPSHGTLSTLSGSSVTYTPGLNYTGPDSFTFKASDGQASSNTATVSISVIEVLTPPTGLSLSSSTVAENRPAGATVGTLYTTDPDPGDTFVYSLVTGTGSEDNSYFSISGDKLKTAVVFDYEARSSYSIRIRTTDSSDLYYESRFIITIVDEPEDPVSTFTFNLSPGWNLISMPFYTETEDPAPENVFAALLEGDNPNLNIIYAFDGCSGKWSAWSPAMHSPLRISDGEGFWVHLDRAASVEVAGAPAPVNPAVNLQRPVCPGWNLIGFINGLEPQPVEEYLAGLEFRTGYTYRNGAWQQVRPGITLQPGWGYWIAFTEPGAILY